jgi:hypothetical protein
MAKTTMASIAYSASADKKYTSATYKAYAYQPTLTLNIGETWDPVKLPANARVEHVRINVRTGTASSTMSFGDTSSATRFVNAASTASAVILDDKDTVKNSFTNGEITTGLGFKYKSTSFPDGVTLRLTVAGANISNIPVAVVVEYSLDHSDQA